MVFTCSEEGESMAMGPERSKPLHNFMLPYLKWGSQRHLRCTKLASDSSTDVGDRRSPAAREFDHPPPGNADARPRLKRPRFLGDEGIDAVREKLMLDLKTEADRMKDAILGKEVAQDNDVIMEEAPPVAVEEEAPPSDPGVRTWNLRTRRAPVAVRIDEKKAGVGTSSSPLRSLAGAGKSPKLRASPEKEEQPVKFSLTLTKKEIEEDFMNLVGHRPPRRPKKRPRNAQKQLDTLFPGQWLSEVSADCYKVPDEAETGKVALRLAKGILLLAAEDAYEADGGFHGWMDLVNNTLNSDDCSKSHMVYYFAFEAVCSFKGEVILLEL
ncbi:unnamed protein product [Sphenostylis stenocarpa]|uniref:Uncharacterized protein n=1 Tax=Sphenostylis stenocarpa TaxID=92480 RepID=A0AA87BC62_9FABA|nr:unnamed protein product [Sphenostylis stenocarpa]